MRGRVEQEVEQEDVFTGQTGERAGLKENF